MRSAFALALLAIASGCAGEARLVPAPAVPPLAFEAPAPEPVPISRCVDGGRACWTLASPCSCAAAQSAAAPYVALDSHAPIAYLDFAPEPRIEYLDLEATP